MDLAGTERLKTLLLDELASRQGRNSSYSLRAFSRDLGVNVTTLSQFFSGRRTLSRRSAQRLIQHLGLSPLLVEKTKVATQQRLLSEQTFQALSEWWYYGILSLARMKKNRATPEWIAGRLGIPVVTARVALRRLVELGIVRVSQGRMSRTGENLTTTHNVPSAYIRKYHKENLKLAADAIDDEPFHRRFLTAITMPTNPERVKKAIEVILRFREEISGFLEQGEAHEVYTLAIQLFPLTKTRSNA